MAQYWIFEIANPQTGKSSRAIAYAADPTSAESRVRQWLASNPFRLGATDLSDFLGTWDSQKHNPTLSMQRPPAQAGDISFDLPSGATPPVEEPPPTDTSGTPPSQSDIPENEPSAQFLRGLAQRGVNLNTIAGRAASGDQRESDYRTSFAFQSLLQGLNPNVQDFDSASEFDSVPQDSFQRFVRDTDIGGVRRGAANSLVDLLSANPVGQVGSGLSYLRGEQGFAQPTQGQAGSLANLAQAALASRISPLALQLLNLPSGSNLRDRFLAEGGQGSFLDYFRKQYPLMGLGI